MDLKNICERIREISEKAAGGASAPVAYINVRVGRKFAFSEAEFSEAFRRAKWDTAISSADIVISRDDSLDCLVRIDERTDFFDEDGNCDTFVVPESEATIG